MQLHHVEHSTRARRGHALQHLTVVPLCMRCHQTGRDAAHSRGKNWQQVHVLDLDARRLDLYARYASARGWVIPPDLNPEQAALWLLEQENRHVDP